MRQKGILITFSGIDGSGKSSQARRLVDWLGSHDVKAKYRWNVYRPKVMALVMKAGRVLLLRRRDMFQDYSGYTGAKQSLFRKNRVLSAVFQLCYFTEYLLQTFATVSLPLRLNRTVVCDRYVYDTVIGLGADLGYTNKKITSVLELFFRLVPKPDIAFLVDVPESIAFGRKTDIPAIEHLERRRRSYLDVTHRHGMVILDGSRELPAIEKEVQMKVMALLDLQKGSTLNRAAI